MTDRADPTPKLPSWTPLYQVTHAPTTQADQLRAAALAASGAAGQNYGQPPAPVGSDELTLLGNGIQTDRDMVIDILKQVSSGLFGVNVAPSQIVGGWTRPSSVTYASSQTITNSIFSGADTTVALTGDSILVFVSFQYALTFTNAGATALTIASPVEVSATLYIDNLSVAKVDWNCFYYGTSHIYADTIIGVAVLSDKAIPNTNVTSSDIAKALIASGNHELHLNYQIATPGTDANSVTFTVSNEVVALARLPGLSGSPTMPIVIY